MTSLNIVFQFFNMKVPAFGFQHVVPVNDAKVRPVATRYRVHSHVGGSRCGRLDLALLYWLAGFLECVE